MRRPIMAALVLVLASVVSAAWAPDWRDYQGYMKPSVHFAKIVVSASGETDLVVPDDPANTIRVLSLIISVGSAPVDVDVHWGTTQSVTNTFAGCQSTTKGFSKEYGNWGVASVSAGETLRAKQSASGTVWYFITWTETP